MSQENEVQEKDRPAFDTEHWERKATRAVKRKQTVAPPRDGGKKIRRVGAGAKDRFRFDPSILDDMDDDFDE